MQTFQYWHTIAQFPGAQSHNRAGLHEARRRYPTGSQAVAPDGLLRQLPPLLKIFLNRRDERSMAPGEGRNRQWNTGIWVDLFRKNSRGQGMADAPVRSEEHTSELQSPKDLVCRLLL